MSRNRVVEERAGVGAVAKVPREETGPDVCDGDGEPGCLFSGDFGDDTFEVLEVGVLGGCGCEDVEGGVPTAEISWVGRGIEDEGREGGEVCLEERREEP